MDVEAVRIVCAKLVSLLLLLLLLVALLATAGKCQRITYLFLRRKIRAHRLHAVSALDHVGLERDGTRTTLIPY